LQAEVENTKNIESSILAEIQRRKDFVSNWAVVLSQKLTINVYQMVEIKEIITETENIAGVDVGFSKI
jgi:hypothetical protein